MLRATRRRSRLVSLASCPEIVAARRDGASWEIHVIRHGRLAGAGRCRLGIDPMPIIDAVCATAETVSAPPAGLPACTIEEAELVASWFEEPGVRLVDVIGEWSWPAHCWMDTDDLAARVAALHHPGHNESDETDSQDRQARPQLTPV